MPITIKSFGGKIGWMLRKKMPAFASWAYTKAIFLTRRRETLKYIDEFLESKVIPKPLLISIETINRCNGSCSFCPCNTNDEKREFKRMTEECYHLIVEQLSDWNYKGRVIMNLNNEPFMDTRIIEWTRYMRMQLQDVNIYLITNGTLLTLDKFKEISPFLDEININNYSQKMLLHDNIDKISLYVKKHPDEFRHLKIDIQYRYSNEILSNRNGTAPNKPVKNLESSVHEPCLEPYTSMVIFPDGIVGLCCFDALEKSNLGNCQNTNLAQIWNSDEFNQIRKLMCRNRAKYEFCKNCDGFSKVIRTKI